MRQRTDARALQTHGDPMQSIEERKTYLRDEVARLGSIVEAARLTQRDVSMQRDLIVQHAVELAELELDRPPN